MVINLKIFFFLIFFFLFNTPHIDSNSSKRLIYDVNDLYSREYNKIYFVNTNTNELRETLEQLDIEILSYIIEEKKYYARSINELEEIYLQEKNETEKILYDINGIPIDAINVICTNNELIKLEKIIDIY